jgi:hypothetical protein
MLSLRAKLASLAQLPNTYPDGTPRTDYDMHAARSIFPEGHLPDQFRASQGLRSLFPAGKPAKLSQLENYIYSSRGTVQLGSPPPQDSDAQNGTEAAPGLSADVSVNADGAGNWCLKARVQSVGAGEIGLGFVFAFSTNGNGHGYIAIGNYGGDLDSNVNTFGVFANGLDAWIKQNWVEIFSLPSFLYMSNATGYDPLPPISNAALDNGFNGLTLIGGEKPGDGWVPSTIVDPSYPAFEYLWGSEMLE